MGILAAAVPDSEPRIPAGRATLESSRATEDGVAGDVDPRGGDDLRGRRLLHFAVGDRIGTGTSGVVHQAYDEKLHRAVAIKALPNASPRRREVLVREARHAAAIVHPNVAAVHDVHEVDDTAFLVMELVRGTRLRDALAGGPLSPSRALALASQAADGLSAAHRRSIVHLDFKPENVVVDGEGQVKILDFGLAARFGRALAVEDAAPPCAGRVRGTPAYMAPEQARGEAVDARADVYALGLVLFEMLAGRPPPRRGGIELAATASDVSAGALTSLAPSARGDLAAVVERCLRASPGERYADAGEVLAALRRIDRPRERGDRRVGGRWIGGAGVALLGVAGLLAWLRPTPGTATVARSPVLRRVTANPRENRLQRSALSPAGDAVAYVDGAGLNVRELDGSATNLVDVGGAPRIVAWLRDGQRLIASRQRGEGGGEELVEIDRRGGAPRARWPGKFTSLAVSHDGKRLLAATGVRVVLAALDGEASAGDPREIAFAADCPVDTVTWAPDDGAVAWLDECPVPRIRVHDLSTGDTRTIVEDPHLTQETGDGSIAWMRDGRLVYALAEWLPREPGSNLWAVTLDPRTRAPVGAPARLTDWVGIVAIELSASDGGRLAFQRYESQTDVFVGDWDGPAKRLASPRRLTMNDRNDRSSAFAPDGRVLFMSDRNGRYEVFSRRLDAPTDVPLEGRGDTWDTWPTPGPGGAILFWSTRRTADDSPVHPILMRADPGRPPAPLYTAREEVLAGLVGRPGPFSRARCATRALDRCFVSEIDGDALVFHTLDPSTGDTRALFRTEREKDHDWDVSPDGRVIAIPLDRSTIALFDARTGASLREQPIPLIPASLAWSNGPGEPGWFVTASSESFLDHVLAFVTLDGRTTRLVEDRSDWFSHPAASLDGRSVVYTVKRHDNDLWVVDGL